MHIARRRLFRVATLVLAILPLPLSAFTRPDPVAILIATSKPYDSVIQRVLSLDGSVRHEYRNIDAIAATLPADRLAAFQAMPEVVAIEKDREIRLGEPRAGLEPDGAAYSYTLDATETSGDMVSFTQSAPDGYFPIETDLMNASDFWSATGHLGDGVVVGIVDTGTADVLAIAGRVIGGESFLSAAPPLDDGLPANSPLNNPHGTWVATTLGANAVFGFRTRHPFVRALRAYLPTLVLPEFFGPRIDGVSMVGPAPFAEFYALKVFNVSGRTATSVILAAFDRAIELKRLADAGDPAGVNLRVLNGSFGGGSLFAGEDPFFAKMVDAITAAGIVTCFSAGNDGPGTLTIGDPGSARNTLTVGSTSIAAYEKVARELQLGPLFGTGIGDLWHPSDTHQVSEFSSRGPTADGRWDPDIVAPGTFIFAQAASGAMSLVSGTSFASPNVAGAAALLLSNDPTLTPDEVRAKLLNGANPDLLDDNPTREDQGFGFVDVIGALNASTTNPPDVGAEHEDVAKNVEALGFEIQSEDHFVHATDWLVPGEGHDVFIEIAQPHTRLEIAVAYEQENDPADQNLLFGDRGFFSVTNSWTHFGTYYTSQRVLTELAITVPESGLDFGLVRINLAGDDDNAGRVRATLIVDKEKGAPVARRRKFAQGKVTQSEFHDHTFEVPSGLDELTLYLSWGNGWDKWPTNDIDLILFDPDGSVNLEGGTLSAPERVLLSNPKPGVWTARVFGFTVWPNEDGDVTEPYQLRADPDLKRHRR